MASYQDLLDAIARVRAATGNRDAWQSGLSGDDIAAACSALSSPAALGAVLAKIVAAHPNAFLSGQTSSRPNTNEGLAAAAIRSAETALAQQNSAAARVDLQVVTAVLNAHAADAGGAAELDRLQLDIENAVLSRTNLDTPAGAREFQRFLMGELRDIRTVVDTAGLDATSEAALAAALASLYATATPAPEPAAEMPDSKSSSVRQESITTPAETEQRGSTAATPLGPEPQPWTLDDVPPLDWADPGDPVSEPAPVPPAAPAPVPMPTPAPATPAMAPAAPAWGGGMPSSLGGLPSAALPDLGRTDIAPDRTAGPPETPPRRRDPETPEDAVPPTNDEPAAEDREDPTTVRLPDGQIVPAPGPQVAAAMIAAIAGTPIPDAFLQQGITLPPPGSPVTAPIDPARLVPGDIGVLADRHALALGNGRALLDQQIQPIATVTGPGFLGWQHPPVAGPTTTMQSTTPQTPEVPAPDRPPTATAPS